MNNRLFLMFPNVLLQNSRTCVETVGLQNREVGVDQNFCRFIKMLSVTETTHCRMAGCFMNDDLETVWMESAVV